VSMATRKWPTYEMSSLPRHIVVAELRRTSYPSNHRPVSVSITLMPLSFPSPSNRRIGGQSDIFKLYRPREVVHHDPGSVGLDGPTRSGPVNRCLRLTATRTALATVASPAPRASPLAPAGSTRRVSGVSVIQFMNIDIDVL
jgi:hypothetical protein